MGEIYEVGAWKLEKRKELRGKFVFYLPVNR